MEWNVIRSSYGYWTVTSTGEFSANKSTGKFTGVEHKRDGMFPTNGGVTWTSTQVNVGGTGTFTASSSVQGWVEESGGFALQGSNSKSFSFNQVFPYIVLKNAAMKSFFRGTKASVLQLCFACFLFGKPCRAQPASDRGGMVIMEYTFFEPIVNAYVKSPVSFSDMKMWYKDSLLIQERLGIRWEQEYGKPEKRWVELIGYTL